MKIKTIVTVVILAFVAVSVVYLIIKETRPAEEAGGLPEGSSDLVVAEAGERGAETAGMETAAPSTVPASDRTVTVTYYYNAAKR